MTNLTEKINQMPICPGVYLMKDTDGNIIYVGKSKHLKNRVQSYFYKNKDQSKKIEKLVKTVKEIDYITTDTELEALLLECKLIQELKPFFNRRLKTPEAYVYIKISKQQDIEQISISHTVDSRLADTDFFGPFMNKYRVEEALDVLKNFFKINCLDYGKKRPCLTVSLGKCMGICTGDTHSLNQYKFVINEVKSFLNGTSTYVMEALEQQMLQASEKLDFEWAAKIRGDLEKIKILFYKEQVIELIKEQKAMVVVELLDLNCLKLFYFRGKDILFSKKYPLNENVSLIAKEFVDHFEKERKIAHVKPLFINKDEIDEGQILFSYIKQYDNHCLIIEEDSLEIYEPNQLQLIVENFLTGKMLPLSYG